MMIDLSGKVALITGASRGIGAATALKFAEAGCRGIAINYVRDKLAATDVVSRCRTLGAEAGAIRADVSRVASVDKMVQRTVDRFGRLDILVANAGIWKEAPIDRMTERDWDETIDKNSKSIYGCCHSAARVMHAKKSGTMIML